MFSAALALLAAAAASACDHRPPVRTTVVAIASDPALFVGRCVTVVGYTDGRSLFASARNLRRHLAMGSFRLSALRLPDMVAVYDLPQPTDDLLEVQRKGGLRWRLTGVVDTCGRMQEQAQKEADARPKDPDTIVMIMMTGQCHYVGGPALRVASGTILGPAK